MNISEYWTHIAAGLSTAVVTGSLDHYLEQAAHLIPNNCAQFLKALLTRQPIRAITAAPAPAGATTKMKGTIDMSIKLNLVDLEQVVEKMEALGSRLTAAVAVAAKAVEALAPIAAAIAPMTGSAAPAVAAGAELAEGLAPEVEKVAESLANGQ